MHLEQLKDLKLEDETKDDIKPGESPGQTSPEDLARKLQGLLTPQQMEALLNPENKPQLVQQTPKNPQNPPDVSSKTPQTSLTGLPPNLLSGLDMLARQHAADNQQHLLGQTDQQTSYTGPLMADIRRDRDTQDKVSLVVDALKNISPVFGQTSTPAPALQGISPLVQLQHQLSSGNLGTTHSASQPLLQTIQEALQNASQTQTPLLSSQNPPLPLPNSQEPLSQLLAALQGTPQQFLAPPPPQQPAQEQLLSQLCAVLKGQTSRQPSPPPPPQPTQQAVLSQLLIALQGRGSQPSPPQPPQSPLSQLRAALQGFTPQPPPPQDPLEVLRQLLQQAPAQSSQTRQQYGLMEVSAQKTTGQSQQKPLLQNIQQGTQPAARVVHVRPTDYSRFCQVEYSEKIKAENSNLVMFSYGYVGQILASLQGNIAPMTTPELVGRLQHFLHLMELTAMFSTNSDYSSFAWHRARNYNSRIFNDLDNGILTWTSISSKMDPTSMMQSIEAVPKPEVKKKEEKKDTDRSTPPCPKWNSCDVKGKCSYEVENPGKTCFKPHICSFCYTKFGHNKTNHKESSCMKKDGEGTKDSLAANGQPTR